MLHSFLSGAATLAAWAIAIFFRRFFKSSGDRLFGFFSAAFVLMGFEHVYTEFAPDSFQTYGYIVRLCAFVLIIAGILDKNRKKKAL